MRNNLKNLELSEISYDSWKKRLYVAMAKYIEFVDNEDRAYGIEHIINVEGGKTSDEMTQNALLIWRARKKVFEVTSEDNRLLWNIEKKNQIHLQIVDNDGKKKFDTVCMKFEFENNFGEIQKFRVDAYCDLIYYDYLKLKREK